MRQQNPAQIHVYLLAIALAATGCGGGGGGDPTPADSPIPDVNQPPQADAGTDISVSSGGTVELAGTASDSDGTVSSTAWVQTSGPAVALDNTNSLTASFTAPSVISQTALVFELTVTDDDGAQATDSVSVDVMPTNGAPVAEAGVDQIVHKASIVQLDGSASSDPESDFLTYAWNMEARPSGSSATLDDVNSPNPTFVPDLPGTYSLSLVVSDGTLESDPSQMTVTAGTPIGGLLESDLLLSQADSPYLLSESLQIPYGISVTSVTAVDIIGNGESILVAGDLEIAGDTDQMANLYNVRVIPATGPVDQLYRIQISFTHFHGGSLYAPTGNAIYGSIRLTDSILQNMSQYMHIWYPEATSTIERNVFSNSGGISVGTRDVNVIIRNNLFVEQTTDYAVENWADYGSTSSMTVELNSFISTDRVALRLPSGYSSTALDGRNNYWSSTDVAIIEGMIFDQNDSIESAGVIAFDPILSEPHPDTPLLP